MNRRNLLVSIGTAAVGTGAVLGSGALTSVTAERTASVGVNSDDTAYVGLNATGNVDEVSNTGSNNQLEIQLPNNLNDEAVIVFGEYDEGAPSISTAAFDISNNSSATSNGVAQDLEIDASVTGNSNIFSLLAINDAGDGMVDLANTGSITLSDGDTRDVVVEIDTTTGSDSTGDDIVTAVEFSASAV